MRLAKGMVRLLAALLCVWSAQAGAVRIDLNPSTTLTSVGNSFSIDVVISGLSVPTPALAVSDFDLFVSYDATLLDATGVSFGSGLGVALAGSDLSALGVAEMFALSFDSYATLRPLQGDSFTLATIEFTALATGTSSLAFASDPTFLVDLLNTDDQNPVNGGDPQVCQSRACVDRGGARVVISEATVPEPMPLLLVAAALLALAAAPRLRGRRQ